MGIVGESGSGKSVAMLAVMGLIRPPGRTTADVLRFDGIDLLRLSPRARRGLVGKDMAMIFQEPMTSLNPCFTIGWQIAEALRVHLDLSRSAARARTIDLLRQVGIPAPEQRISAFPHLLSGGMNQRAMIAMAIACNPRLLIADEPTTALDVTIQKQILDLLATLQRERGMALVLISHDMGVIAQSAQRVQVMYAGQAMESRPAPSLLSAPSHPYTAALLAALPEHADSHRRLATIPGVVPALRIGRTVACSRRAAGSCSIAARNVRRLLRTVMARFAATRRYDVARGQNLTRVYPVRIGLRRPVPLFAVSDVSFTLAAGRTLAVVGESGCGKSTLARMVTLLERPTSGTIEIDGRIARSVRCGDAPRRADGVSGSVRIAQSAAHGRADIGRTAGDRRRVCRRTP